MLILENVYYINLKNRIDRKINIEKQLNELEWKYERFDAIKNEVGCIGCSMSNLAILEDAKNKNLDYVVILEDDIHFTKPSYYNKMLNNFLSNQINFDVLLICSYILNSITVNDYIKKVLEGQSTAGYLVKSNYYDKLIDNYKDGINLLLLNPNCYNKYAIDQYWKVLQPKDNWYILYPRTVSQIISYSDIEKKDVDYNNILLDENIPNTFHNTNLNLILMKNFKKL